MSPHPIPSLSGFNPIMSRRVLFGGATAVAAAGVLSACGSSSSKTEHKASETPFYEINEQDASKLKQGGTLNLSTYSLGPDFNRFSQNGSSTSVSETMGVIAGAGIWRSTFKGEDELDPNYCLGFEAKEVDGKITAEVRLNPKAVFNDGTPIDIDALKATWQIQRDPDGEYKIAAAGIYEFIESVEAIDGDRYHARVVFKTAHNPVKGLLFGGILHPAMLDVNLFNEGFVDNPHPELGCGPFTLAPNGWNSSEKTFTAVPNDKWWGEKPKLDRIVVREMADAAARAAYKNGELDVVESRTLSAYNEMKDVANSEIRRGRRLFAGGMNLNAEHITDVAVRKAIFLGIDRGALAKIRFQGLPYEEEVPGSMLLLGSSPHYHDNYPARNPEEARKVLEKAGYTKSGDFYAKDGKTITLKLTTFGDDATTKGQAQTFIQSMKEIGINFELDSRAQSEFSKVVGNREYDVSISGFGVGSEPTSAAEYFYHSKNWNGVGTPEIDAMVDEMVTILDDAKRAEKCNEIEKKHMSEVCLFIPFLNGPDFKACRPKLANYGAFLFKSLDWSTVGWMA